MENKKIAVFCLLCLLLMVIGVIFFNKVSKKDNSIETEVTELGDFNNVPTIDAKLGDDISITQSYLMKYFIKKSGIWYESNGQVTKITTKNDFSYITISDGTNSIIGVIDSDKCNVKKNDNVNFVGSIDIENGYINLSKIDTNEINYNSSTKLELSELINNVNLVRNNYFIISGYLVTEDNIYKLFDSKSDYEDNNKPGYYFKVNWDGSFGYTGKQNVQIKCNLSSSYSLKNCTLVK